MVKRAVLSVGASLEVIKDNIKRLPVAHFDETGVRVNGHLHWAHAACNKDYVYISVESARGQEGMKSSGILPDFKGVAVHDFWKSYEKFESKHAYCNAHILKELQGIYENTGQKRPLKMIKLLVWSKNTKNKFISMEKDHFSSYCLDQRIDKLFGSILFEGIKQNPPPPKIPGKREGSRRKLRQETFLNGSRSMKKRFCFTPGILRFPSIITKLSETSVTLRLSLKYQAASEFRKGLMTMPK